MLILNVTYFYNVQNVYPGFLLHHEGIYVFVIKVTLILIPMFAAHVPCFTIDSVLPPDFYTSGVLPDSIIYYLIRRLHDVYLSYVAYP